MSVEHIATRATFWHVFRVYTSSYGGDEEEAIYDWTAPRTYIKPMIVDLKGLYPTTWLVIRLSLDYPTQVIISKLGAAFGDQPLSSSSSSSSEDLSDDELNQHNRRRRHHTKEGEKETVIDYGSVYSYHTGRVPNLYLVIYKERAYLYTSSIATVKAEIFKMIPDSPSSSSVSRHNRDRLMGLCHKISYADVVRRGLVYYHTSMFKTIIITANAGRSNYRCLSLAAATGNTQILEILIDSDAFASARMMNAVYIDTEYARAIDEACIGGHFSATKVLMNHAYFKKECRIGRTYSFIGYIVIAAARANAWDIVHYTLQQYPNVRSYPEIQLLLNNRLSDIETQSKGRWSSLLFDTVTTATATFDNPSIVLYEDRLERMTLIELYSCVLDLLIVPSVITNDGEVRQRIERLQLVLIHIRRHNSVRVWSIPKSTTCSDYYILILLVLLDYRCLSIATAGRGSVTVSDDTRPNLYQLILILRTMCGHKPNILCISIYHVFTLCQADIQYLYEEARRCAVTIQISTPCSPYKYLAFVNAIAIERRIKKVGLPLSLSAACRIVIRQSICRSNAIGQLNCITDRITSLYNSGLLPVSLVNYLLFRSRDDILPIRYA